MCRSSFVALANVACLSLALMCPVCSAADAPGVSSFRTQPGFVVETVYLVPRETQGSWVALTVDHRGRLIASDQSGGLYRLAVSASSPAVVEPIDLPIG